MRSLLIKIAKILILSIAIEAICVFLGSTFLVDFLRGKTVELLITLMAINTATSSFIVGKLQEIAKEKKVSFSETYMEIRSSLVMQLVLIVLAVVVLTLETSKSLPESLTSGNIRKVYDVILIFVFVAGVDILRDTGIAMFDILLGIEELDKQKKQ